MKSLALLTVLASSLFGASFAHADDGGIVAISVNDLSFATTKYDTNGKQIREPIKVDGTFNYEVQANGKEAGKLMQVLPPDLSVMTGMYRRFPKWVDTFNKNNRTLYITGKDNQPSVMITCLGGTYDYNGNENQPPKFTAFADGAHCTITVLPLTLEGDVNYSFDPHKNQCGK